MDKIICSKCSTDISEKSIFHQIDLLLPYEFLCLDCTLRPNFKQVSTKKCCACSHFMLLENGLDESQKLCPECCKLLKVADIDKNDLTLYSRICKIIKVCNSLDFAQQSITLLDQLLDFYFQWKDVESFIFFINFACEKIEFYSKVKSDNSKLELQPWFNQKQNFMLMEFSWGVMTVVNDVLHGLLQKLHKIKQNICLPYIGDNIAILLWFILKPGKPTDFKNEETVPWWIFKGYLIVIFNINLKNIPLIKEITNEDNEVSFLNFKQFVIFFRDFTSLDKNLDYVRDKISIHNDSISVKRGLVEKGFFFEKTIDQSNHKILFKICFLDNASQDSDISIFVNFEKQFTFFLKTLEKHHFSLPNLVEFLQNQNLKKCCSNLDSYTGDSSLYFQNGIIKNGIDLFHNYLPVNIDRKFTSKNLESSQCYLFINHQKMLLISYNGPKNIFKCYEEVCFEDIVFDEVFDGTIKFTSQKTSEFESLIIKSADYKSLQAFHMTIHYLKF